MSRWRPRLGTLAVLSFIGAATLGFLVAQNSAKRFLRERLSASLDAGQVQLVVDDFGRAFVAFAATAVLLGAVLAGFLAVQASRNVRSLRRETLRRARGRRDPLPRPPIAELSGLAAAIELLATELEARADTSDRERRELAILVQSVSEGILLVGPGNRILHANPAARTLLALPLDCRGQTLDALIRQGELRRAIEAATAGDSTAAEVDLDDRRLLVVTRRVATDDPSATAGGGGIVVALIDLTKIRRLEGVRRDFVANVSHELKTPLTSIRGYVETLLADDPEPDIRSQFLNVIKKNTDRLQHIVDDLLDLSRIESGGWKPALEDVNPARIAAETWEGFAQRAREGGIASLIPPADPLVRADPSALRHIFGNLFDNAIRHTGHGGTITVLVRPPDSATPGRLVAIEVRDTGTGIPREALPRIFERFYRADPARSRAEGGTGLGLSIVKHLTESMEGDVSAASELGKGTSIRVRLPDATPADATAHTAA